MERVIVTVRRADRDSTRDLELPAEMPMAQLVPILLQALRWPFNPGDQLGGYTLEALPLGRLLGPDETLVEARVWDGAWLVFHPDQALAGESRFATGSGAPLPGWRQVDMRAQQKPSSPASGSPAPSQGFVWKRLDEE